MSGRIIYDPRKDPRLNVKQGEEWKKYMRKWWRIVLFLFIIGILLSMFSLEESSYRVAYIIGISIDILLLLLLYVVRKGYMLLMRDNIKILEDGILFEFAYCPKWLKKYNPFFVPYQDILGIERKMISKNQRKYLELDVKGKTAKIGKDLIKRGWLVISEIKVPDLNEYEKILREQWEKYNSKRENGNQGNE